MSENENLDEKFEAVLDAHKKLSEFADNHPGEFTFNAEDLTFDFPPEWQRLGDAFDQAKEEYEVAIRKDERTQIKALIDEREPQ
jgi:hypothetical protein